MGQEKNYYYLVEGDDDKKVVNTLKSELRLIIPGRVEKFNVVQDKLNKKYIRTLKRGTTVVLVFDVDAGNISILEENIKFLKQQSVVKNVICITQVMNLEEELVRSCSIKEIKELTKSKSNRDFKRDVLRISNFESRLKACRFEISKFWNSKSQSQYSHIINEANKIKL